MSRIGSVLFREDDQGLSLLNTGIPAYSARISREQLRHRQAAIGMHKTDSPLPFAISWFGARPTNELELIDELWIAVDAFIRERAGTPEDRGGFQADGNRKVTVPTALNEESSRLSMSHS